MIKYEKSIKSYVNKYQMRTTQRFVFQFLLKISCWCADIMQQCILGTGPNGVFALQPTCLG